MPRAIVDWVCHRTSHPVGLRVNAPRLPGLVAATISGVASRPPMSAIASDAAPMTLGTAIVACCSQVRPSITRITPKYAGSMPVHDSRVRSVKLYDVNTIDGAPAPSFATIGVASTFTWSGYGSPAGGPVHSHWSTGKNTPG